MSYDNIELAEGTLRQRRNLLAISLFIIFISHAEVSFGNELKIMGTAIYMNNPDFIRPFLLLGLAYALWRFYQYFHTDNAYLAIRGQYRQSLTQELDSKTLKKVFYYLPDNAGGISGTISYSGLERVGSHYEISVAIASRDYSEENKYAVKIPCNKIDYVKIPYPFKFLFRGRLISDFFLPYFAAAYAALVYVA